MDTSIYSSSELREFQRIINEAVDAAHEQGIDMPIAIMARRLFDAARQGERDPARLKAAALSAEVIQLRAYGRRLVCEEPDWATSC